MVNILLFGCFIVISFCIISLLSLAAKNTITNEVKTTRINVVDGELSNRLKNLYMQFCYLINSKDIVNLKKML